MPLRKIKDIPKVPRSHKKSIDKLKASTPASKKSGIEYTASFFYRYDAKQKKQFYIIALETSKLFSSLNYEIALDVRKAKSVIDISIMGLNALQSYRVQPLPAVSYLHFEDLFGDFTINVIKQDGSVNSADVYFNVFKKEITLKKEFLPSKKNNRKFVVFKVEPQLFTFPE